MIRYALDQAKEELARDRFTELTAAQGLMAALAPGQPATDAVSASRLCAYASGALGTSDPALDYALDNRPSLRRAYRTLLSQVSSFHLPEALAASSDALPTREGEGCRVSLQPSRAEPDQVYVIVELTRDREAKPETLIVCDREDRTRQIALPPLRNGVAQVIVEKSSDLLIFLSDPKAEVYLR
jgi:hypothetical protein